MTSQTESGLYATTESPTVGNPLVRVAMCNQSARGTTDRRSPARTALLLRAFMRAIKNKLVFLMIA